MSLLSSLCRLLLTHTGCRAARPPSLNAEHGHQHARMPAFTALTMIKRYQLRACCSLRFQIREGFYIISGSRSCAYRMRGSHVPSLGMWPLDNGLGTHGPEVPVARLPADSVRTPATFPCTSARCTVSIDLHFDWTKRSTETVLMACVHRDLATGTFLTAYKGGGATGGGLAVLGRDYVIAAQAASPALHFWTWHRVCYHAPSYTKTERKALPSVQRATSAWTEPCMPCRRHHCCPARKGSTRWAAAGSVGSTLPASDAEHRQKKCHHQKHRHHFTDKHDSTSQTSMAAAAVTPAPLCRTHSCSAVSRRSISPAWQLLRMVGFAQPAGSRGGSTCGRLARGGF